MNKELYEFEEKPIDEEGCYTYTFLSVGDKGNRPKMVAFQPIGSYFYNLAFD